MKRCSATTHPNVPPPTMMVSKARVRPPTICPALSSASCKLLQRKRPILSSVNVVDSEPSSGAMTCHSLLCVPGAWSQPRDLAVRSLDRAVDQLKLMQRCASRQMPHRAAYESRDSDFACAKIGHSFDR